MLENKQTNCCSCIWTSLHILNIVPQGLPWLLRQKKLSKSKAYRSLFFLNSRCSSVRFLAVEWLLQDVATSGYIQKQVMPGENLKRLRGVSLFWKSVRDFWKQWVFLGFLHIFLENKRIFAKGVRDFWRVIRPSVQPQWTSCAGWKTLYLC